VTTARAAPIDACAATSTANSMPVDGPFAPVTTGTGRRFRFGFCGCENGANALRKRSMKPRDLIVESAPNV
jgi:hypothetical protein